MRAPGPAPAEVAVVVPAFRSARFVGEAVRSAREQSLPPCEIVVVDDGSDDDTADVAAAAGATVLRQPNAGPGAARNRGIAATSSEFVAFLDADDVFLPDKLARQVASMQRTGAEACACDAFLLRDGVRGPRKNAGRSVPGNVTFLSLLEGNPLIASTMVVRREALLRAGGFDEDRVLIATEDWDLWLRLAAARPILYLDEPLALYRVHGGHGASLSDDRRFVAGVDRIVQKVLAAHPSDADVAAVAAARRAAVRCDAAWHLARRGEGALARRLLREARQLGGRPRGALRIWLRSLLARPRRSGSEAAR